MALAVILAGAGYIAWRQQARDMRGQAEQSLAAVGKLKASELSRWLGERRSDARTLRANRWLAAAAADLGGGRGAPEAQARVETLLGAMQQAYGYDDVVLADREGRVLARVFAEKTHPTGERVLSLIRAAVKTRQAQESDLFLDEEGHICMVLAAPLLGDVPGASPVGAVVLHVDPEGYLYPLIHDWPLPSRTGETLLVERRGDRAVYLNDLRHASGAALTLTVAADEPDLVAAMAVSGRRGVVEGIDYRGIRVLAALRQVEGTTWVIVAKVDEEEVLGPIAERGWFTAGFTALLVCVAGAGALLLWRARERRAIATLAESEVRYRSLVESSPMAVFVNRDDTVALVNAACMRLFGATSAEQLLGRSVYDLHHPDCHAAIRGRIGVQQSEGEAVPPLQERIVRVDGAVVDVEVTAAPYRDQEGDAIHVVLQDISERKRAETERARLNAELERRVRLRTAQLDAANDELEAFAYSVSHDLRAPLRHITGFSELLGARCAGGLDDKALHYLDTISTSARDMGVLIDDLLEFSRTGRAEVAMEAVDMEAVLEEALAPLRHDTADRDIVWQIDPLPCVPGDRALLRQVWANLVGNAVKYTRDKAPAHIVIGAESRDDEVVFFVADDGVGFDMDHADKLFGVFQRLHSASEFEGTGIGLATAHSIVTKCGGRIWAEGAVGKGATFYFSVPGGGEGVI